MEDYKEIENIDVMHVDKAYVHKDMPILVMEVSKGLTLDYHMGKEILEKTNCNIMLTIEKITDAIVIRCVSHNKKIRAIEYLDFIFGEYGIIKGNEKIAEGKMSLVILEVRIADMEIGSAMDFFKLRAYEYFVDLDVIDKDSPAQDVEHMSRYKKQHIPWAVVKTLDIVPEGELINVKTLENPTGVNVIASEDTYIMIGCRGEVYDITSSKFHNSYEESEEVLDVLEEMLDFIPAVETVADGTYIPIDEIAHLCYPKVDNYIYARQLSRRTKVFMVYNEEEYFVGKAGDYLAVRGDDIKDVYIIQKDIFTNTYEEIQ